MNERFCQHVETLAPKLNELLAMPTVTVSTLPSALPTRGVYVFSDGQEDLYVGRTNTLRKRLQNHCRPSSTHHKTTFAYRLAREATGNLRPSYKAVGSRANLLVDPVFAQAFIDAKRRLNRLNIRFVEESDPIKQCLLEVYIAVVLEARYNDFDNH